MSTTHKDEARERLHKLLQEHVEDLLVHEEGETDVNGNLIPEGGIVSRWVITAEIVAPDGDAWITRMTAPGQTDWQTLGLLRYEV